MSFAQMISMIGFSSIFPFLPLYVKSLGTVTSISVEMCVGLVYSGQAFSMMLAAPIWGSLADRWGRKLMVQRAMFGGCLLIGLMAFVGSAEELVLLRVAQGLITGVMGSSNALVAAVTPRGRTGFAMGTIQVSQGLGLGLGPVLGGLLADAYGYRMAFLVTAGLLALAGLVVLVGAYEPERKADPIGPEKIAMWQAWKSVLASQTVLLILGLRFINHVGRIIFIPILPLFILSLSSHPSGVNSLTGIVTGISSAATALFSIYLGRIGDRRGHRHVVVYCMFLAALALAAQSLINASWQLVVLQLLFGITIGGIVPGISALLAVYSRQGDEGSVYGIDTSITAGARVVGPLLGVGISVWFGFQAVFAVAALLYLLAGWMAIQYLPKNGSK